VISSMRAYFKGLKFVLLLVIVAFIATSVVYFGASSVSDPAAANAVATVNGEAVPIERYQRALASYMDFYQRIYRERLTSDFVERLGIPDQVVAELVQEALIVQQAAREGIRVTDDDLRASILAIRAFQEDGRFSRERYRAVLRRARLDEGTFETEQRRELVRRRMETLVKQGVKVSEEELREAYAVRRETVRAAWASLPLDRLGGEVAVADAEIEPYLKAHEPASRGRSGGRSSTCW
jgi:peptidyl-prolyl cis-trans isomerase D